MPSTRKNSQLCPECRRLISRDEPVCPYCGLRSPGSPWKNIGLSGSLRDPDLFLKRLIGVNIAFYLLAILLNPKSTGLHFHPFDFLSPDNRSLLLLGATGTLPISGLHRWWSLLAANYLHGSLLHLIFNMLALRQLGPLLIQEYGLSRMFIIYTLGGIGGFLLSWLAGVRFTIGASAAVCALIGAAFYYGKSRGGFYGEQIARQIGGWALGIFVFGFLVPGINNWAHGGGMAVGALCGLLLGYQEQGRERLGHKSLATLCAAATALVLLWAATTALFVRFLL